MHTSISPKLKGRDSFLDIAKGLAIILVVIGHVIQGSAENFDDLIGFKIIYSFHMPLFIFLSGAVAAISFDASLIARGMGQVFLNGLKKIRKAAIRLLFPFIAWCVLNQLIYQYADSIVSALLLAFRRPDTALWFLLAIFYCITLISIFQFIFSFILWILSILNLNAKKFEKLISSEIFQITFMILIWWLIKSHTPHGAGLALLKPYFIYYLLGVGFYKYLQGNCSYWYSILAGLAFICLAPFWLRTAEFQYAGSMLLPYIAIYFYAGIVAISGAGIVLGCARAISSCKFDALKKILVLCGQLSLGIYAIHYFFLSYSPKIIAPLLLSILISYVLNKIPLVKTVFLGER
jgi:fucose 4-O-acetylase-like acetyltransferase